MRIIRPNGFLQLAVPDSLILERTEDWGYPDAAQHGHNGVYGRDIVTLCAHELPGTYLLCVAARDICTGVQDIVFFLSHQPVTRPLTSVFPKAHFQRLGPDSVFTAEALRIVF